MAAIVPTSKLVRLNDTELCVHTWLPSSTTKEGSVGGVDVADGVIVLFHGFLAHGLYPTVRYAAELLVAHNYIVVAADARGHGQSTGMRDYLPSKDVVLQDGVAVTKHVQELYGNNKKYFLVGSSMGGTIALNVAQSLKRNAKDSDGSSTIAGIVLLAPMLQLSVGAPARSLLWALSYIIPTWSIISSSGSANAEKQYRDPIKRQECIDDGKKGDGGGNGATGSQASAKKTICVASASTCVELASTIRDEFSQVDTPFIVMVADDDVVVNNQGSLDLFAQSPLQEPDKTIKHYPALHGLLCESPPLIDTIQADLLSWIRARS